MEYKVDKENDKRTFEALEKIFGDRIIDASEYKQERSNLQTITPEEIRPELKEFMIACEAELKRHDTEKGDSWKEMELPSLITLFSVAMANWYDKPIKSQENNDQLIDIANFAMMLWYRQKAK